MTAVATSAIRRARAAGVSLRPWLVALARVTRRVERRPRLWLAICGLILAVQISPWWYCTSDGTLYLLMARSHVDADSPVNPDRSGDAARGYSLLISPAFLLGDRPFLALSVMQWLFAVAMVLGVYQWGRQLAPRAAIWIALLTAVNASVCYYYRRTLKEIVFMAAAIWTINALQALLDSDTRGRFLRRLAVAAALLSATILIRYSAVVLVPGFVLAALLSRRPELTRHRRRLVVGAVAVLAVVVFGFVLVHDGKSYFAAIEAGLSDTAGRVTEGLRLRIGAIVRICAPGMFKAYAQTREWLDWNIALGVLLVALVAAGWYGAAVRRRDPLILTFPLYVGLYMIWPFDQGARFMVAMVPVLIACFWFGMARLPRVRSVFFAGCFAAHVSTMLGYWLLIDAPRAADWHGRWTSIVRLAEQVDVTQGSVACVRVPNEVRHMLTICLSDPGAVLSGDPGPDSANVRWVVQPEASAIPDRWQRVASAGDYMLLQRSGRPAGREPIAVSARPRAAGSVD